jgi:hypothetical protein
MSLSSAPAALVATHDVAVSGEFTGLRGWSVGSRLGFSDFAVVPALERPDLSPFEISARTTSQPRFPSAAAPRRTMTVPMPTVDQVKYAYKLPDPFNIGVADR